MAVLKSYATHSTSFVGDFKSRYYGEYDQICVKAMKEKRNNVWE